MGRAMSRQLGTFTLFFGVLWFLTTLILAGALIVSGAYWVFSGTLTPFMVRALLALTTGFTGTFILFIVGVVFGGQLALRGVR